MMGGAFQPPAADWVTGATPCGARAGQVVHRQVSAPLVASSTESVSSLWPPSRPVGSAVAPTMSAPAAPAPGVSNVRVALRVRPIESGTLRGAVAGVWGASSGEGVC